MSKKPRYFMVGGNGDLEEYEEDHEHEVGFQDNDALIAETDRVPDAEIDKVIDYIIRNNIDPNYSKGIQQFGKREYIKRVLDIIENPIQPVFPDMKGGKLVPENERIKPKDIEDLNYIIQKGIKKLKQKGYDIVISDFRAKIIQMILDGKEITIENLLDELFDLTEYDEAELERLTDAVSDAFKELIEGVAKARTETRETTRIETRPVIRKKTGKPSRRKTEDVEVITTEEVTIEAGKYYTAVIEKFNKRRDNIQDVLKQVDLEGLKRKEEKISFPNILTMCNFSDILAMTDDGFDDRVAFVKAAPDKFKILGPEGWTVTMENSLRAENTLAKILTTIIYPQAFGTTTYKYENVFQLVDPKDATAPIDIILNKKSAKGFIEIKGAISGGIHVNKFFHMMNEYNSKKKPNDYYYAAGRAVVTETAIRQHWKTTKINFTDRTFRLDVIPNQIMGVISTDEITVDGTIMKTNLYTNLTALYNKSISSKATIAEKEKAKKALEKFMEIVAVPLGYKWDGKSSTFTLPGYDDLGNSIKFDKNINPETYKNTMKTLKDVKVFADDVYIEDFASELKNIINEYRGKPLLKTQGLTKGMKVVSIGNVTKEEEDAVTKLQSIVDSLDAPSADEIFNEFKENKQWITYFSGIYKKEGAAMPIQVADTIESLHDLIRAPTRKTIGEKILDIQTWAKKQK